MALSSLLTVATLALGLVSPVEASLYPRHNNSSCGWWLPRIKHQGVAPFVNDTDYPVFRNVADFNATGDGTTDDTEAINKAISFGGRCGVGCSSSTTRPAVVYFPPGVYRVSDSIIQHYYTQFVGDAQRPPTIKADKGFKNAFVIDANPYQPGDASHPEGWLTWTPVDNFYRSVRNLVVDISEVEGKTVHGIHWPVAQATSLQNIVFNMAPYKDDGTVQQGLLIEGGSGGHMSDLVFNGGKVGMGVGNQQFTSRNLEFHGCQTAISMYYAWQWVFQGITIDSCQVGIDMPKDVASAMLIDSVVSNTKTAIKTAYDASQPFTNGTLVLENVDMSQGVQVAVKKDDDVILEAGSIIGFWAQGRSYVGEKGKAVQEAGDAAARPKALTHDSGKLFTRKRPQYEDVPASKFVSVKSKGARGDGVTDDTNAIRAVFSNITQDKVVYFDFGVYLVTDTVRIPPNVRIVGEAWSVIMAGGDAAFKDENSPKPVFQVGQPGDVGTVEIQDLTFLTSGAQPGAILMEFNVAGKTKGATALFDVHFRIGGAEGSNLQLEQCKRNPESKEINKDCLAAFLLLHVTPSATLYVENSWMWTSDHDLDAPNPEKKPEATQITIYTGRGLLVESTAGAWFWGTASEHNVLYNYQLNGAANVFMGLIQTETPYFQGNPDARQPFEAQAAFSDPDFSECSSDQSRCARSWGLRVENSSDVLVYGGGLYNFFDAYDLTCQDTRSCQDNMISVSKSSVDFYGMSTRASTNMIVLDGKPAAKDADNINTFCSTVAVFRTP
ncbi:glucan 1,3-beta-glucosidase GLUC78 precursor [Ophiocordyceps camponoti-floridani]|uniref:Glucan 1,3-beta-glucosidase GLUC78 n=1 Tax=Ophiocordyceps camponoti-floridani TaxID=2030778 RepID=A0A8H4Q7C1_9HYPO|nr:glucan 1,3-beta-glucosidase GLUC78 precursor [Ophiocordyceps camponoti-floridani]